MSSESEDTCWVITYLRGSSKPSHHYVISDISPQQWFIQARAKDSTIIPIKDLKYEGDDYFELKVSVFQEELKHQSPSNKLKSLEEWKASPQVKEVVKSEIHEEWVKKIRSELHNKNAFGKFRKLLEMEDIPSEVSSVLENEIDSEVFEKIMEMVKDNGLPGIKNDTLFIKNHFIQSIRDMLLAKFSGKMSSEIKECLKSIEYDD